VADFPHRDEAAIHARARSARHATHADTHKQHPQPYDEHLRFTDEQGRKVHRHYHPAGKILTPVVVGPHDWAAYEADPQNYEPDYLRYDETVS
jgi:hypothetical protein